MRSRALPYEVLIVDDGSTDATAQVAEAAASADRAVRLVRLRVNEGKGSASAVGARHATGSWILFSDADLSTPIDALEEFVPYLSQGYDIVIGSRALAASRLLVRQAWWRERVGRAMNAAIRNGARLPFRDTQCGFKLYSREAAQTIFPLLTTKRWLFDAEALLVAAELGYRVREVPVTWVNSGDSRVKLRHGWNILRELAGLSLRRSGRRTRSHRPSAVRKPGAVTGARSDLQTSARTGTEPAPSEARR